MRILIGLVVILGAACAGLFFTSMSQGKRIAELEAAMGKKSPSGSGTEEKGAVTAFNEKELESRVARLESQLLKAQVALRLAAEKGSDEELKKLVAAATDPSAQAGSGNVLDALESDDPEVRDRIKAVIREEQAMLREEERELRQLRRAERIDQKFDEFSTRVNLSEQQNKALSDLLSSEREKIRELRRKGREGDNGIDVRKEAQQLRSENDAKVKELLDDDQYEEFSKVREERGFGGGRQGRGGRGGGGRGGR
jgi:hypothetical protein